VIVLDTHAWVWFVSNPELLSKKATAAVEDAVSENRVFISSISAWEVALLVAQGRLELTMEVGQWVAKSESLPFFQFVPVNNAIAVKSVALQGPLHADPADRIIIATAHSLGASIITKDKRLRNYPHIKTIW
jgi:PIN domain nuclease of toxin-antitoxin system